MATKKRSAKASRGSSSGRGSAEAIEKRRTARTLNALLEGGGKRQPKLDGRTEKRRARLIKELKEGKSGKPLKPADVVGHTDQLMEIGETLASLKKQGVKPRKTAVSEDVLEAARATQKAYGFRAEAWKMLGLNIEKKEPAAKAKGRRGKKK